MTFHLMGKNELFKMLVVYTVSTTVVTISDDL